MNEVEILDAEGFVLAVLPLPVEVLDERDASTERTFALRGEAVAAGRAAAYRLTVALRMEGAVREGVAPAGFSSRALYLNSTEVLNGAVVTCTLTLLTPPPG